MTVTLDGSYIYGERMVTHAALGFKQHQDGGRIDEGLDNQKLAKLAIQPAHLAFRN